MTNKAEEERRIRIRELIQDSKKVLDNYDQKKIKPKHHVIAGLMKEVQDEIDFLKHWIGNYELSSEENKEILNEEQKDHYQQMIVERKSNLEELRNCFAGLHRVYQHVGLNRDDH